MSIPRRWEHCPRIGQIVADKFLPFKTPLSFQYDGEVPKESRFDVSALLQCVEGLQKQMGMVIDLTNLDRYYDKRELTDDKNINHYKLQCEGFGEIPTMEQVEEFKRVCSHFFAHHPEEIIGVHCTHGYNRTGFLLISHLVEADNWGLEAALATLAQARPPGVYKQDFLDVLSHRYGDDQRLIGPSWPAWCEKRERAKGDEQYKSARFMEGVSGAECVGPPTREDVQQQCQHILQWESGGFPGSQPVSMDVRNISLLHKNPYRVSCKADGTRYMMYIRGRGEVYMLNRSNAVFRVPHLSFPSGRHLGEHLTETLLDGEMVIAKNKHGSSKPCYLIYDIIQFESSTEVALCDHNVRMAFVSKEVVEPRDKALHCGCLDDITEPFSVLAVRFWNLSTNNMEAFEDYMKTLTYEHDGYIFTPATAPYVAGQCMNCLKWKPAKLNSVDFKLGIVSQQKSELPTKKQGELFVGGCKKPFDTINLEVIKDVETYNGRIIECSWDSKNGWQFMRVREDKNAPNSYNTAMSVIQSIRNPITRDMLLTEIDKIPVDIGLKTCAHIQITC